MFDSPFDYCAACGQYVLLDQTQKQCAREHGCAMSCPIGQLFTGIEFLSPRVRKRPCVSIRQARP